MFAGITMLVLITVTSFPGSGGPKATVEPTKKQTVYFATRVGAKWVYKEGKRVESRVVTGVSTNGKDTYVSVSKEDKSGKNAPLWRVKVTAKGLVRLGLRPFEAQPPIVLLKLPIKSGQHWKYLMLDGPVIKEEGTMTCYGPERVTVPAGTFTAVRVVAESIVSYSTLLTQPVKTTYWYAPGVGLVKRVDHQGRMLILQEYLPAGSKAGKSRASDSHPRRHAPKESDR